MITFDQQPYENCHAMLLSLNLLFRLILEWKVELRSMFDGKPHKHASQPALQMDSSSDEYMTSFCSRITGDTLGILQPLSGSKKIFIWNWKTGVLRSVCLSKWCNVPCAS